MKITLITMDQMIISYGVRIISSCLRKAGFEVDVIFARAVIGQPMDKKVQKEIVRLCKDSKLIGISLMSNHFPQAKELTSFLKQELKAPIVWGGVHPTFCPEESLNFTDIVCVGEGETAMVNLAQKIKSKKKILETPGFWFKDNEQIIKNNRTPLISDLDKLPFPDYGPQNHFIRDEQKIKTMTKQLFRKFLTKRETSSGNFVAEYYIATSRGCPFRCSYCASNTIKNLYVGEKFFRLRSPEKVIEEVKILTEKFDFIKWIYFADDDLLASPLERIKKFCSLWKKEINLPFYATLAPWSYNEEKLKIFIEAGLQIINMGIQTISKRGCLVYHRMVPKKTLKTIIKSIHQLNFTLPPVYDFILDNPYEKDTDKLENLDFLLDIPTPRRFQLFSLIPFPGTEIYNKMKNDKLIADEEKMIYQKSYSYPEATYINMLMFLSNANIPLGLIKFLRGNFFLTIFNNGFSKWVFKNFPYSIFLTLARNTVNLRFWRFNASPKGEN